MWEIDWVALRQELAAYQQPFKPSVFFRAMRAHRPTLHRSTIHRVIDVQKKPKHAPDLDTIAAWLAAAGKSDAPSTFIARFERQTNTPLVRNPTVVDDAPTLAPHPQAVPHVGPVDVSADLLDALVSRLVSPVTERVQESLLAHVAVNRETTKPPSRPHRAVARPVKKKPGARGSSAKGR